MWSSTVTIFPYAALLPPPLLQREAAAHLNFTTHMYTHSKAAEGRPNEDHITHILYDSHKLWLQMPH